jgi:hypothetical protein
VLWLVDNAAWTGVERLGVMLVFEEDQSDTILRPITSVVIDRRSPAPDRKPPDKP